MKNPPPAALHYIAYTSLRIPRKFDSILHLSTTDLPHFHVNQFSHFNEHITYFKMLFKENMLKKLL